MLVVGLSSPSEKYLTVRNVVKLTSQLKTEAKVRQLTRAPLGSAEQRAPLGGGGHFPLRSREPRNLATSGKRRWIALGLNSLKHVPNFLKIEVTEQVKLKSKVKYYSFLQWRLLRSNKAL